MSKSLAIQNAQRAAFHRLADKEHMISAQEFAEMQHKNPKITGKAITHNGMPHYIVANGWHVKPDNITCPSVLVQELPLDGSTNNLVFNFSQLAPVPTPQLNNVNLGINNIACLYGIQVLLGVGAVGATRQYLTHGLLASDGAAYQGSNMSFQFEQSELVKNIDMNDFQYIEGTNYKPEEAIKLINPLRLITGRLGTNNVTIATQPLTGLVFTPNLFVSVRLQVVLGQASGTN